MPTIRPVTAADHDAVWSIFHVDVAPGDTYAFDPAISRADALAYWLHADARCFVTEHEGAIVGTCIVKPNQPGQGAHVANAAFMVASEARDLGIGRAMGEHCLREARRLGYRAMQFNFVVSTNEPAVRLGRTWASRSWARCQAHSAIRARGSSTRT